MKIKLVHLFCAVFAILTILPAASSAQVRESSGPDQIRVGWGGYPLMESLFNVGFGTPIPGDYYRGMLLNSIYGDYSGPVFTTGVINAELSWYKKDWFTFSLATAASFTWENFRDSMTGLRTGTDVGLNLYVVPQVRFNWLRRETLKMYSSFGFGALIATDFDEFNLVPAAQITPIGFEVGRKLFWFCEAGLGMLYFGGQFGIGYRF